MLMLGFANGSEIKRIAKVTPEIKRCHVTLLQHYDIEFKSRMRLDFVPIEAASVYDCVIKPFTFATLFRDQLTRCTDSIPVA
jgi:hypothetical protein